MADSCRMLRWLQTQEHLAALGDPELYTHRGAFSMVASRLHAPSLHPGNNLWSPRLVTYRRLRPALHPTRLTVIREPLSLRRLSEMDMGGF